MRKVILSVALSLDGYIEGPNGEYDWCFTDQDYGLSDFFKRIDAMFIGRKSYELLQGMDASDKPFPKMEEYIFSNTLTGAKEDAVIVSGDIKPFVEKIKQQEGKDIWMFGGASLTTSLMNDGLIDELMIAIHPIILGSGKPLFIDINGRIPLTLTSTKSYETGLVMVTYDVKSS